jgi:Flp pilus assembly protein TadD
MKMTLDKQKKMQDREDTTAGAQVIDAGTTDRQMRLGIAQLKKGNVNGAVSHFKEVLRINSDYEDAKRNLRILTESR